MNELEINRLKVHQKYITKILKLTNKEMGHLTTPEIIHILEDVEKYYMDKNGWKWEIKRQLRCYK